jgi:hypothetical protein
MSLIPVILSFLALLVAVFYASRAVESENKQERWAWASAACWAMAWVLKGGV